MGFDLSTLTVYVNQEKQNLILKTVLGANTLEYIRTISGIKSAESVNILDGSDIQAQIGGACSFNPDGGTAITQVLVAVEKVAFMESYCLSDLENYFTQNFLSAGTPKDMGGMTAQFVESKSEAIAKWLDAEIWLGDKVALGSIFDGLLVNIKAGSYIDGNPDNLTEVTSANVIEIVEGMVDLQPNELILKDTNRLFVSPAIFRLYSNALLKANLYHHASTADGSAPDEMFVAGTNIKLTMTNGLSGDTSMVLAEGDNLVYGTDMVGEDEDFELFYAQEARDYRFISTFKAGTAVVFADEVVLFEI